MALQSARDLAMPEPRSDRLDTDELMQLMRRNLWMMVLVALTITAITAAYLSTRTPIFRTQAAMVLTNSEIRMSQIDAQLQSYELTRARVETELDVLRSRSFAEQVAKSIGLFDNLQFMPVNEGGPALGTVERARAVIDKLLASYALHRGGESLVITVQVDTTVPELAAQIANGVIRSFIDLSVSKQTTIIDGSIAHLEKQITQMGEDLSRTQYELADFIRSHTLDDASLPDRLRREESHLTSVLEVMTSDGRADSDEARRITANLQAVGDRLAERTRNELDLGRMNRSSELMLTRYQTTVERLSDLERQRDLVQPDARQITAAETPYSPAWPNTGATLALTFPAGMVLAFVFALLRSAMSQQVWDSTQVARIRDLPSLGMVPHLGRQGLKLRRRHSLTVLRDTPHSAYSEAIRSLATKWSDRAEDAESKVLMVTSGQTGEGRTTIATAIAVSAAVDGMRTLLIDMDSQNRGVTRGLGMMPSATTFGQIVDGTVPVTDGIQAVGGYDRFDVMAFQANTSLTPKVLRQFVGVTLPQLRQAYDLIIVDTPPALALADAIRFGTIVDQALLVVRAGNTNMSTLRNCFDKLRNSGVDVAGAVINDVSMGRYRQMNKGGSHG